MKILNKDDKNLIKILLRSCFHLNQMGHRSELTGQSALTNLEVKNRMMGCCPACLIDDRLEQIATIVGIEL